MGNKDFSLYLASGIKLWENEFKEKYSEYFNRKVSLFEPGTIDTPKKHKKIPITIATYDLDKVNKSDALLVYMKYYDAPDNSPAGTDSTWECGYGIAKGKPVIMLIEDEEHMEYYVKQWMVAFSINAVLTTNERVAERAKNHPKLTHTTVLLAQNPEQFESKITEYLTDYYRSIYSRSGKINYYVDKRARKLFEKTKLKENIFVENKPNEKVSKELEKLEGLEFDKEGDYLNVCRLERNISKYLKGKISLELIDSFISAVIKKWDESKEHTLACLKHSIVPPFKKQKGGRRGVKKTRPELFYELNHIITHHILDEDRFVNSKHFRYDIGAVIELYNWMNTYALDDVFDNSKTRQKEKTVWNKFTRRDAVYTGIIGHLLALKCMFYIAEDNKTGAKKISEILNSYNHMMYKGQVLDLVLTFDSEEKKKLLKSRGLDELFELYIQRIYGICGGFYEAIGKLSSKASNKEKQIMNPEEIDKVSPLIGMYYGIIQMIRNDLGDYIMPEDLSEISKGMKEVSHSDIREGKADIAYLFALHSSDLSEKEKEFLMDVLNSELTVKQKLKINKLLWKSGAINFVVEVIKKLIDHVEEKFFTKYHETPTRTKWMFDLVEITDKILIPFKKQAFENNWPKYEFDLCKLGKLTDKITDLENKDKDERLNKLKEFKNLL